MTPERLQEIMDNGDCSPYEAMTLAGMVICGCAAVAVETQACADICEACFRNNESVAVARLDILDRMPGQTDG